MGEPLLGRINLEATVLENVQPAPVRPYPEAPGGIDRKGEHAIARKAVVRAENGKSTILEAGHPSAEGTDPQAPLSILGKGDDAIGRESVSRAVRAKHSVAEDIEA